MNKSLLILSILFIGIVAVQDVLAKSRVAILGTEDDGEPPLKYQEISSLTAILRDIAINTLPSADYDIMTEQSMLSFLGSTSEMERVCKEASGCLAKIGREIEADLVGQARISRFGKFFTVKVEVYDVVKGTMVGSFADNKSKDIYAISDIIEKKAPEMFKKISSLAPPAPPPPPPASYSVSPTYPNSTYPAYTTPTYPAYTAPTTTATSGTSGTCDSESKKARAIYDRCVKMDKASEAYKKCAGEYKQAKDKADQICKVGSVAEQEATVQKWETLSNQYKCRSSKNASCQTILSSLATELFKLENIKNTDHVASLPVMLDYIKYFPDTPNAPNILFQAAIIYEMNNDHANALKLRQQLVAKYPNHAVALAAWLRIGEYYYDNSKWTDAIKAYEKVTGGSNVNGREGAYAMYRLAECYYNMGNCKIATQKFQEYIDGAAKGKYISDLRNEAMNFIAKCK